MKLANNYKLREMRQEDVKECLSMALESFGTDQYPEDQFNTIEEEFNAAFTHEWWGRPNYFICELDGIIVGMGGYSLSWLDWDTFEFFWLSVRKGYEGRGIGGLLVNYRENHIKENSAFKKDITILFSCTNNLIEYHKKHGYKVLIEKADGKEVIMGKTFLK